MTIKKAMLNSGMARSKFKHAREKLTLRSFLLTRACCHIAEETKWPSIDMGVNLNKHLKWTENFYLMEDKFALQQLRQMEDEPSVLAS